MSLHPRGLRRLRISALAIGLLVLLAGVDRWRDRAIRERAEAEWGTILANSARHAERVIESWVDERCRDAIGLTRQLERIPDARAAAEVPATLADALEPDQHLGAWVLDTLGRPVANAGGARTLLAEEEDAARRVWRVRRRAVIGPYQADGRTAVGFVHWAVIGGRSRVVVLRADAARLYALVPFRFFGSTTGQSRIVGRDARGQVVVLSPYVMDARRPPNGPLTLHGAAAGTVEALAAAGVETTGVFRDLRGRRVVASSRWLPLTGWALIRSIDEAEVFAREADHRRFERMGALAAVALAAALFLLLAQADRARRLRTLRESERRYRLLADHAQDLITLVDAGGVVCYASPASRRLLGWAPEELVGLPASRFTAHPADVERIRRAFARAVPGAPPQTVEHGLVRRDGSVVWVESSASGAAVDGGHAGTVVVTRDVSARVALEAELREARTLEAVGRLAGGVAHDFNNVLSVVRLNAEELLAEIAPDDPRREAVEQMRDAASRAASLTRQLLSVGRRQVLRPRVVRLHDVVRDAVRLLHRTLGEQVRLDVRLMAREPLVSADPEQLRAAVLDLALFARDAMPAGGVLSIETADDDDTVRLTMRDTGRALDADARARLFEPYAFGGVGGRRVGFGLSAVDGLVRQSGGSVRVESADGAGTSFHIALPRSVETEPDADAAEGPADEEAPRRHSGPSVRIVPAVVLLAEDEGPMREIIARLLRRAGHEVVAARDGEEALAMARRLAAPPDVVVTDVVMPGLGGPEMVARLRQGDPALPVIYMSGYAADAEARGALGDAVAYLRKPFPLGRLLDAVEAAAATRAATRVGSPGDAGTR